MSLDYLMYTPPSIENEKRAWVNYASYGGILTPPESRTSSPIPFAVYEDQLSPFNSVLVTSCWLTLVESNTSKILVCLFSFKTDNIWLSSTEMVKFFQ